MNYPRDFQFNGSVTVKAVHSDGTEITETTQSYYLPLSAKERFKTYLPWSWNDNHWTKRQSGKVVSAFKKTSSGDSENKG